MIETLLTMIFALALSVIVLLTVRAYIRTPSGKKQKLPTYQEPPCPHELVALTSSCSDKVQNVYISVLGYCKTCGDEVTIDVPKVIPADVKRGVFWTEYLPEILKAKGWEPDPDGGEDVYLKLGGSRPSAKRLPNPGYM